jgi:hypothetical protein
MWHNLPKEEERKRSGNEDNFAARVVEIHSGDSLTVERESDFERIRLFLACIKAPKEAKVFGEKGGQV